MAEKSGSEQSKPQLRQEIARSRELVARDWSGLRYELDFPLKFKKVFQRHTLVWVGGALALGLCVALLRARTQKVYLSASGKRVRHTDKTLLESGVLLGAAKLLFTLAQPMIVSYFAKKGARSGKGRPSWAP